MNYETQNLNVHIMNPFVAMLLKVTLDLRSKIIPNHLH
jgi:hypothetical protein